MTENEEPGWSKYQSLYDQALTLSKKFITSAFKKFKKHNEPLSNYLTYYENMSLSTQHTVNIYILLIHNLDFKNKDLQDLLDDRSSTLSFQRSMAKSKSKPASNLKNLDILDLPSDKMTRIKLAEIIERNFGITVRATCLEYKVGIKEPTTTLNSNKPGTFRNSKFSAQNQQALNLVKFLLLYKIKRVDLNLEIDCPLPEDTTEPIPDLVDLQICQFLTSQNDNNKFKVFLIEKFRLQKFEMDEIFAAINNSENLHVDLDINTVDFERQIKTLKLQVQNLCLNINLKITHLTKSAGNFTKVLKLINDKLEKCTNINETSDLDAMHFNFTELLSENLSQFKLLNKRFREILNQINDQLKESYRQPILEDNLQALKAIEGDLDLKILKLQLQE